MSIPFWDFSGNTMVTNNYVRLTPDLQSKSGILWNSVVCKFAANNIIIYTKNYETLILALPSEKLGTANTI